MGQGRFFNNVIVEVACTHTKRADRRRRDDNNTFKSHHAGKKLNRERMRTRDRKNEKRNDYPALHAALVSRTAGRDGRHGGGPPG
jgi:hypothetical protein